ncbi:DUF7123 family protein [Halobaculum gomorrense]|uniref:DUF7123 domain-containing protein n=1 Tax=Halobaculum gomorrense TaxID=43928 RepID=A0A1M5KLF4_9EURY|nr:hypothetical protein [Halobaculum gomorrense]SHG53654.1 hypothetical protein SAMN05443636_0559 [Halobaculum gomorrense]
MSATSTVESIQTEETATVGTNADLSDKQHRILAYLREHAAEQTYFKSRLIAEELGLSAKEVGANMSAVVDAAVDIDVEKWGYSSGTTWMVTR